MLPVATGRGNKHSLQIPEVGLRRARELQRHPDRVEIILGNRRFASSFASSIDVNDLRRGVSAAVGGELRRNRSKGWGWIMGGVGNGPTKTPLLPSGGRVSGVVETEMPFSDLASL